MRMAVQPERNELERSNQAIEHYGLTIITIDYYA